jgi:outer membrane immunogenic protein
LGFLYGRPTARMTMGIETMKKFLLGTVGLVAFGMAAPATAADLTPYTKAPLPALYVSPIYESTGFYIGANGGWDSSHSCVDFLDATGVKCR